MGGWVGGWVGWLGWVGCWVCFVLAEKSLPKCSVSRLSFIHPPTHPPTHHTSLHPGISWFGIEKGEEMLHGLNKRPMGDILDFVKVPPSSHPPTHPPSLPTHPTPKLTVAHSNPLFLLYPPNPPTYPPKQQGKFNVIRLPYSVKFALSDPATKKPDPFIVGFGLEVRHPTHPPTHPPTRPPTHHSLRQVRPL